MNVKPLRSQQKSIQSRMLGGSVKVDTRSDQEPASQAQNPSEIEDKDNPSKPEITCVLTGAKEEEEEMEGSTQYKSKHCDITGGRDRNVMDKE